MKEQLNNLTQLHDHMRVDHDVTGNCKLAIVF